MSDDLDSGSFNKNYRVLKETADWLSGQKEPDIDQLVPKVEKAMQAYSICKDRLDKVQASLVSRQPLMAPVQKGRTVATLKLAIDDRPIGEYPVVALENVPVAGIFGRAWDTVRLWLE